MVHTATPRNPSRLDESLLGGLAPFALLNRDQIREILDQASVRRHFAGKPVFEEDAPAERFFLLLDGYVRVIHITPTGEQVIALHIPAGELFGIAKALGRTTYPATAIAVTDSIVVSWPTRLWGTFVERYEGFSTETYKSVGHRVSELNTHMIEMSTQHVEQRIACALLRLVNQTGRKVDNGIEIDFPITRQDLSEMTGTTLHTVSRLLTAWEKRGIVMSARKKITVTDAHQLVLLSGGQ